MHLITDVHQNQQFVERDHGSATVTIIDAYKAGELQMDTKPDPDADCSCACEVCAAPGLLISPHDGSMRYVLPSSIAPLPSYHSDSTNSLRPIVRAHLAMPHGQLPTRLEVSLNVIDENGTAVPLPGTYIYDVDPSLVTNDEFGFALQPDFAQGLQNRPEINLYNVELRATAVFGESASGQSPLINGWVARQSLVARDAQASSIAPGWNLPFLKQLVVNQSVRELGGTLRAGIGIIRGDNSASWYSQKPTGGFEAPAESRSTLESTAGGYKLTHRNKNYDLFDTQGRLVKSVDRNGNETHYDHSLPGQIKVVDPLQQVVTYTFTQPSANVKRTEIKDTTNRITTFEYVKNANGNGVLTVTYPDPDGAQSQLARQLVFTYTNGTVTEIKDTDTGASTVQTTSISYNALLNNRVQSAMRADGTSFIVQPKLFEGIPSAAPGSIIGITDQGALRRKFNDIATVTDGNQNVTQYILDNRGRVLETTDARGKKWTFNRNGGMGEVTAATSPDPDDFGALGNGGRSAQHTAFQYDERGNLVGRTQSASTVQVTESWTYDAMFNTPTTYTNELGHQVIDWLDPANGNVVKTEWRNPALAGDPARRWQNPVNKFDVNANQDVVTLDALAVVNELNRVGGGPRPLVGSPPTPPIYYDANGDDHLSPLDAMIVINYLNRSGYTNVSLSTEVSYGYTSDGAAGLPDGLLASTQVNTGRAVGTSGTAVLMTNYAYYPMTSAVGSRGRLQTVTHATDSDKPGTVTYSYDAAGNVTSVAESLQNSGGSLVTATTQYRYDNTDRLVAELGPDPDGTGPQQSPLTRYRYDSFGNVVAMEQVNHNLLTPTSETTSHVTCYAYDAMNRLTRLGEASQPIILSGSDANVEARFAAAITLDCSWLGSAANWGDHPVTQFAYDANGNLTGLTDANTQTTTYEYDELNRLDKQFDPPVGSSHFTVPGEQLQNNRPVTDFNYDNVSNLWSVKDALGNETHYRYDDLNRLTSETGPAVNGVHPVTTYAYTRTNLGWHQTVTDPLQRATRIELDFLGRVVAMVENGQRVTR